MVAHLARLLSIGVLWAALPAFAQTAPAAKAPFNETVIGVPKKMGPFTISLETTLYKPDGDGPFPVALINHGKADGDPRFQPRFRPLVVAGWLVERGYAVVVPMRQGFSKSGGSYVRSGCNVESNGRVQAEDVKAVLDHVVTQPWADRGRILVIGQSHGGWTTLAFGALQYPGVRGLVNFAGGLRQPDCPSWQQSLASGAGRFAKETRVPSLWFYGENDSYFDVPTWTAMHDHYRQAGGDSTLIPVGKFGSDSHTLFFARAGAPLWQPPLARFLQSIDLPSEPTATARTPP